MEGPKVKRGFIQMDRISNLSDDLLLKILSSLPTKEVVATMFLSKRWKFLWTMVRKLDFEKDYYGEVDDGDAYRAFQLYVDRFLVSHKSPVLETLKLTLGCFLSRSDDITTWTRIAIARRVRELEIYRSLDGDDDNFKLPEFLYTYEKLVVLKLFRSIVLIVPQEVHLSSLKSLHLLSLQYKNKASHRKLLAGCPVLEELVFDETENDPVPSVYVIVPSLKTLSVLNMTHEIMFVGGEHFFCYEKVVINVPSLEYLNYVDIHDFGHRCFSKNMPKLVEANVKLVCESPHRLMRSITSVKRLSLCLYGSVLQHRMKFCQLVDLELCGCSTKWWNLLTWMLESSPKLQVLKLNKCKERYLCLVEPIKGRWRQPSLVPECLQLHLNTFEWKYYNGGMEERKLVAYILKNAKRLKTAALSNQKVSDKRMVNQNLNELVSLPRASSSCQLLLD